MASCTFCGSHDAGEEIRDSLRQAVLLLIEENGVDSFYIGNHGRFDSMALSVVRELKEEYPQIVYSVVLAYLPGKRENYKSYSESETCYPEGLEMAPMRFAISYRNKWMVNNSQYIVSYVKTKYGGSYQTLQYAKRKGLAVIEL